MACKYRVRQHFQQSYPTFKLNKRITIFEQLKFITAMMNNEFILFFLILMKRYRPGAEFPNVILKHLNAKVP